MTIGASVFCIAVGAILTFGVETDSTEGINVNNIGIILMVIGALGLAFYALIWGPRTRRVGPQTTVIREDPVQPVVQQRVVSTPVVTSTPVVERRVYEQ